MIALVQVVLEFDTGFSGPVIFFMTLRKVQMTGLS
jgi:hypothetical protein